MTEQEKLLALAQQAPPSTIFLWHNLAKTAIHNIDIPILASTLNLNLDLSVVPNLNLTLAPILVPGLWCWALNLMPYVLLAWMPSIVMSLNLILAPNFVPSLSLSLALTGVLSLVLNLGSNVALTSGYYLLHYDIMGTLASTHGIQKCPWISLLHAAFTCRQSYFLRVPHGVVLNAMKCRSRC